MSSQFPIENLAALDAAISEAQFKNDWPALTQAYRQAGHIMLRSGEIDAACFVLTNAYVYALECGNRTVADEIWQTLEGYGRER